ncbi:hypothetical protein [Microbulbifer sp. SAOS-129_SWC]|uniref:hypothetical protein n=1 Tax=Microbulbifer sp. SAOS-129_SWC TaxID=3145235 RepID=UPI003217F7E7
MNTPLLHIGRDKTGTTAIQTFLANNKELLNEHGFFTPESGIRGNAHHLIGEQLATRNLGWIRALTQRSTISSLLSELAASDSSAIITSEAFQRCYPFLIRKALRLQEARVIVYIRNQIDYIASAYTQRVHATNYTGTINDYFRQIKGINYARFLERWHSNFPSEFCVRPYDKKALTNGSIVDDFIRHGLRLPVDLPWNHESDQNANPSLNQKTTQFKLYLNRSGRYKEFRPGFLYRALPLMNSAFPAPKLTVSKGIAETVRKKWTVKEAKVAQRYFNRESLFDYQCELPTEIKSISESEILEMWQHLMTLQDIFRSSKEEFEDLLRAA